MPNRYAPVNIHPRPAKAIFVPETCSFNSENELKLAEVPFPHCPTFCILLFMHMLLWLDFIDIPSIDFAVNDKIVVAGVPGGISEERFEQSTFGNQPAGPFPAYVDHTSLFRYTGYLSASPGMV